MTARVERQRENLAKRTALLHSLISKPETPPFVSDLSLWAVHGDMTHHSCLFRTPRRRCVVDCDALRPVPNESPVDAPWDRPESDGGSFSVKTGSCSASSGRLEG
mmetsp:Transcript_31413/g.73688  ORF Transcript_31413/g.73688 Transcript_31413/m.73688 type:complete len:105 (-) Transcript_31413:104-418(-)